MHATHLECANCQEQYDAGKLNNVCVKCGKPLLARYDLPRISRIMTQAALRSRKADLWRYREVLPVRDEENIVSLGEGWTPLLSAPRLGAELGLSALFIKDESLNPTASFKARGMSVA